MTARNGQSDHTVCAKSPVRCICYSIIASPLGITAPCSFFLCVGPWLRMLRTKFHHPQTKTFCLRGDLVDCTTERKSLDSTPVPEAPGGVKAEEAAGRHRWQGQPHQVLACQSEQQWALFRAKIVSIRDF